MKNYFRSLLERKGKTGGRRPSIKGDRPKRADRGGPVDDLQKREETYKKGDVIGDKFEVNNIIGRGGYGIVYKAYNREHNYVCAVKTFHNKFLSYRAKREAFKKEALLWVNLDEHAFILTARWVREFSGRLFVFMDYIAPDDHGRVSLQDHLIRSRRPLDTDQALQWAIQFCYGMEHANAHGIRCHRDIKPANILIMQGEIVKISDFGLAAAELVWKVDQSQIGGIENGCFSYSLPTTEGRKVYGTVGHIAPEVYEHKGADLQSDIYSFGIVLWQMVMGSPLSPFHAAEVRNNGDNEKYWREYQAMVYERQKSGHLPKVNSSLKPMIERCLAVEPSGRYKDFRQLREELQVVLEDRTGQTIQVPLRLDKTVVFWNNKGASLDSLGRHQEGIACYDKALEIDPRHAYAWNNKGLSLNSLGRYDEAVDCCNKSLEIEPRNAYAWNHKGLSLHSLGRHHEAIDCHNKALEIDPLFAPAWGNKGLSLTSLGRYQEAIECYNKSLEIEPLNANTWFNKGLSLHSLGYFQEGIAYYDKTIEIEPRHAYAWNNKGLSLYYLGRYDEAMDCCIKSLEIEPRNAYAWNNKGLSLDSIGRHHEAIDCHNKALQIDPQYAEAWYNKGLSLASLDHYDEAIECYSKALEIDPRYVAAWNNKGNSLASLSRNGEAIECYNKALDIDPRDAAAWCNKAVAEETLGRTKDTVKSYRKFIECTPAHYVRQIAYARQRLQELEG